MIWWFEVTALLNILVDYISFKNGSFVLVGLSVRLASASRFLEINHLWKANELNAKMRRRMNINKCVGGHSAGRELQVLVGGRRLGCTWRWGWLKLHQYTAAIRTLRILQDLSWERPDVNETVVSRRGGMNDNFVSQNPILPGDFRLYPVILTIAIDTAGGGP